MAGIGFTLKKLFQDDTYTSRGKAYLYSALVAAGPWISAVVTVNMIIFIVEFFPFISTEKDLFMGTIVYSFVFSQIIASPWQMIITRYIADKLYSKDYDYIRASFAGLNKIVFSSALLAALLFYFSKPVSIAYKVMAIYLFVILAMIWILMTYLSAIKNYELIAKAYIYGGLLSVFLTINFSYKPIPFSTLSHSSNILFSYLIGLSLTYVVLAYNFLSTFYFGNKQEYDFIRYLNRLPSLFLIGLFYTLGLWADDILMWLSIVGVKVHKTYLYAPIYDNAVFLAYLTTIPTSVLFLVTVETEFYDSYKKYFSLVNTMGDYNDINTARQELKQVFYKNLFYVFQVQSLLSISIILMARPIFNFLGISILIRNIFRICALGALFNIFILIIILFLLYFEARIQALIISIIFFMTNLGLTHYYSQKGLAYYGYGFTIGAFLTFIVAVSTIVRLLNKLTFRTFMLQPLFVEQEKGMFVWLADVLNKYKSKQERGKNGMGMDIEIKQLNERIEQLTEHE